MDLQPILVNAQNPDKNIRDPAERQLDLLRDSNFPAFAYSLTAELANNDRPPEYRRLAALVLKNTLDAKDDAAAALRHNAWLTLDPAVREQIKSGVLQVLASPIAPARNAAAQVVAKIAKIELPRGQWPTLIDALLQSALQPVSDLAKQATLNTLGYICEELQFVDTLAEKSNQILTAVVNGMRQEEPNPQIRLAAVSAFYNALEFARGNFQKKEERDFMMMVVCQGCSVQLEELREKFFECLVKIAGLYYDFLSDYMQRFFDLTLGCIKLAAGPSALQAIEFWCTVCDEEIALAQEAEDAKTEGYTPDRNSMNYIGGVLKFLVPILNEALTKRGDSAEEEDDEEWNLPMAAGTCLSLIAQTVKDLVVPEVMPFVTGNINHPDPKFREAATLAFGSILEGPTQFIQQLIRQALPLLVEHMNDPSVLVKDTTAWTLGRICQCHPMAIRDQLQLVMTVFLGSLGTEPRVAANVAWAIHMLGESVTEESDGPTGPLSPYFGPVMQALITAADRKDASSFKLRSTAYEAMNSLIASSAADVEPLLLQTVPAFLDRLQQSFQMPILTLDDKEDQVETQQLLCSVLLSLTQKLEAKIKPNADRMMLIFLQLFSLKNASLHVEAFMAVGSLANGCESEFDKYLPHLLPFLTAGLRNWEEHEVCFSAVGVVGDVCRAVGVKIEPFCDELITILLQDLTNPRLNREVKPLILGAFGDIALAIGGRFDRYLGVVMNMLQSAAGTQVPQDDDDMLDYLNDLREGILTAFTGIIQGLRTDNKGALMMQYAQGIYEFIHVCWSDINKNDAVKRAAVGTLGDLSHCLEGNAKPFVRQDWVRQMITACMKDKSCKENAKWAKQVVDSLAGK